MIDRDALDAAEKVIDGWNIGGSSDEVSDETLRRAEIRPDEDGIFNYAGIRANSMALKVGQATMTTGELNLARELGSALVEGIVLGVIAERNRQSKEG